MKAATGAASLVEIGNPCLRRRQAAGLSEPTPSRARKNCVLFRANPHAIAIAPHVTAAGSTPRKSPQRMRRMGVQPHFDVAPPADFGLRYWPHTWEVSMNKQRNFLLFALFAAAATPALAQTAPPAAAPAGSATHDAASIPDFSRVWAHPALPWYEPPASGPGPITNRSRGPQRPSGISGSQASPPLKEGVSNYDQLVGDYTSPILQP
jgi:hypothetical protein